MPWSGRSSEIKNRRDGEKAVSELRILFDSLTSREREVMEHVVAGLMNKQIAAKLGITEITVKVHRGHMMRKMKARSVIDLAGNGRPAGNPSPETARAYTQVSFSNPDS